MGSGSHQSRRYFAKTEPDHGRTFWRGFRPSGWPKAARTWPPQNSEPHPTSLCLGAFSAPENYLLKIRTSGGGARGGAKPGRSQNCWATVGPTLANNRARFRSSGGVSGAPGGEFRNLLCETFTKKVSRAACAAI